jgi:NAD(P)-dependent dehydrogenase (short-subunit alcohol dehydrogenase family)
MRLDQKVALVTSSAPGISANTAKQLASEGARVVICGRDATQGLATVKQIRNEGGRATFVLADIAVTADVQVVIDETIATYGRLDILFNNISNSYARDGLILEVSESVWDRVIEPLLKGTFFCCQYALPFLQQSGSGTIINLVEAISSQSDPAEQENRSVSAICQGGVLAMTSAIAQQFPASTVTANLIWATAAEADLSASPALSVADSPEAAATAPGPSDSPLGSSAFEERRRYHSSTGNLLLAQTLTHPVASDRPFANIAEAVMYLACNQTRLHGCALLVQEPTSEPATPN